MKVPLLFLFVSKFTGAELNPVHITLSAAGLGQCIAGVCSALVVLSF